MIDEFDLDMDGAISEQEFIKSVYPFFSFFMPELTSLAPQDHVGRCVIGLYRF